MFLSAHGKETHFIINRVQPNTVCFVSSWGRFVFTPKCWLTLSKVDTALVRSSYCKKSMWFFCWNLGVRIIHGRALYNGKYGTLKNINDYFSIFMFLSVHGKETRFIINRVQPNTVCFVSSWGRFVFTPKCWLTLSKVDTALVRSSYCKKSMWFFFAEIWGCVLYTGAHYTTVNTVLFKKY